MHRAPGAPHARLARRLVGFVMNHHVCANVRGLVIWVGLKLAFIFGSEVRLKCRIVKGLRKSGIEIDKAWVDVVLGQSGNLIGSQS